MSSITIEHVSKAYPHGEHGSVAALRDVSLKVTSGEVLALLGPSGCGKTTLLRIIAGLVTPDQGRVLYDTTPLPDIPNRERNVGMVFQDYALAPHWKAERTVGFFLHLRQREQEISERVRTISKITGFGFEQLLPRKPATLSGGEKQRVAIARALTRDLRLLLLDEPFANLDAKLRTSARIELKRLLAAFPVTTVYVTHDQHEAVALADRIAVLREGQIVQLGTYRVLYDSPVNLFIATFIGTPPINLFEGRAQDGHWQGVNFSGLPIRRDLPDGIPVTLGVRPELIQISDGGIPCRVERVTPYYAERFQQVDVEERGERWSLCVPLEQRIAAGDYCQCSFEPSSALFFDAGTGARIG
jgi:multiple sugar transport system ATP-binding protein